MHKIPDLRFLLLLAAALPALAQAPGNRAERPAVGLELSSLGPDFGFALEATSSYLCDGKLAFRGCVGMALRKGNPIDTPEEMTVEPYAYSRLGVVGVSGMIGDNLRLYGEGGLLVAFPKRSFSSHSQQLGGYGHFGFEFLLGPKPRQGSSYFIELGAVGMDTEADRQVGKPVYMHGFAIHTGFRIYL